MEKVGVKFKFKEVGESVDGTTLTVYSTNLVLMEELQEVFKALLKESDHKSVLATGHVGSCGSRIFLSMGH